MTEPTLYRVVDVFPYLEREDVYSGLTLAEAAIRMDDLTGVGEDVILSDWDEACSTCEGGGQQKDPTADDGWLACESCGGDGKWPGPWEWTDPETGREVTMRREIEEAE